jgi:hypothetical protein
MNNKIIKQVFGLNYLGYGISYCQNEDISIQLNKFEVIFGTIKEHWDKHIRQHKTKIILYGGSVSIELQL